MDDKSTGARRALITCATAALFLAFLLGGVFATFEWQPYQFFEDGVKNARKYLRQMQQVRPDILQPNRYWGNGVTIRRPGAYAGVTAVQGNFAEGVELRLIDMSGRVIHRWSADFDAIWPDPAHVQPVNRPASNLHYQTHGMAFLPDGSVVFIFDNLGAAKLDRCGKLLWKVDRATHHAVTANPDGSFWMPARVDVRDIRDEVLLRQIEEADLVGSGGRYEDSLLLVTADGRIDAEISVLASLFDGRFATELFDVREFSVTDPTHLNDVEVVTPELARRIPGVEAGDLLVSLRQMHMLAILDRQTGAILWSRVGPWVRQHDPDITPDGLIEVFNNGDGRLAVDGVIGSSILTLDPATGEVHTAYPRDGDANFFTRIMGAHQRLPNGNRLLTESQPGRLLEVDPEGDVVWEYVQPYDRTHAALIQSATRYDADYFQVKDWSCAAR
jgi:hypothetical protein